MKRNKQDANEIRFNRELNIFFNEPITVVDIRKSQRIRSWLVITHEKQKKPNDTMTRWRPNNKYDEGLDNYGRIALKKNN